jgi:hypothetical protein
MAPLFMPILIGRGLPRLWQTLPEPSIINEKTIADFARVVEITGILRPQPSPSASAAATEAE